MLQTILKRKRFLLASTVLLVMVISLSAVLTYLLFFKIPELNKNITQLNTKLDAVASDIKSKDELNKSFQSNLATANKSNGDLANKVSANEVALSKQQACTKANEFSQIPAGIVLRTAGESGGNGCGPSNTGFIPSSTQDALTYIQGFLKHYKDTGTESWQHNPDVCLYDAKNALPTLEIRFTDYQKYKQLCGS